MEQLPALLLLAVGIIIIIVFAPLAWRKAKEEAADHREPFGQVLSEEIRALETQLAQLKQEYQALSHKAVAGPVEHVAAGQVNDKAEQVVQVSEERTTEHPQEQEALSGKLSEIQLYRQVFQAYDEGKSVTEIAKELGRGKGEIELILNLRR